MSEIEGRRFRVFGIVQGVYFRQGTRREALRLGVHGFARNEDDGSVTIEAAGELAALQSLEQWCRHGPPGARVDRLIAESVVPAESSGFDIR